ncbi:hypothetical protein D3P07_04585 [Paenibacillus sp. 1011MAR3C5]|uniref:LiaF transmembrane domain-containing protein n=1 Tax=Paenibacillus sp. 1011MAR3C5 TaxID=1675787 RepID=UPI000E6D50E6|nr:hypothetical protein [Paenibacillus sp. 1011MAR3C5]RJE91332.1 hypothetical protein D3P07_04585 [Paenibacillus sp. 1011MAR3C5]
MNGKSALGVLLIVIGGLAVLNVFNINLGWIFGLLLPFILIGFGVVGWMNNKKIIGGVLIAIGGVMLLGKLGGIFMLLLAIGLIAVGVSLFRNKRSY